jgi:hypothetical protein
MFAHVRREAARITVATVTAALALAACGANTANEDQAAQATGRFPARVRVHFPLHQRLAEPSQLIIAVTNTGTRAMPNVAVTITNPAAPGAQAFGTLIAAPAPGQPILAGRSRAVWVIDRGPGPCGYSCHQGGPGAAVTSYTNTWALGRLDPGHTATFDWHLTALAPGAFTVAYRVAAGLSGKAPAVGATTAGALRVAISSAPLQASVNAAGQVVQSAGG